MRLYYRMSLTYKTKYAKGLPQEFFYELFFILLVQANCKLWPDETSDENTFTFSLFVIKSFMTT